MKKPRGRNDGHIFDYSKVADQIYLGSDMCSAGVCKLHGVEFENLGVDVEINLGFEDNERPPENVKGYVWLPVVDGYSPSQSQLDMGTALMHEAIKNGKKVYVHCKNGHGRSPTMVAAYLIRYKKMNPENAEKLLKKKRPEIHIEVEQMKELSKFAKRNS